MEGIRARDIGQVDGLWKRANPNIRDDNGFTPLVNALAHYNIDVIDLLIKRGAVLDLDSSSRIGEGGELQLSRRELLFDAITGETLLALRQRWPMAFSK